MRLFALCGLLGLLACSSASTTGGSSSSGSTANDAGAEEIGPEDWKGTWVFASAKCGSTAVTFQGYKETLTLADATGTSVVETSGCKVTTSGVQIRKFSEKAFELIYATGTQACMPEACTQQFTITTTQGSQKSTPAVCKSGSVMSTGGNPPAFVPRGDTLDAQLDLGNGVICTGSYVRTQ